MTQTVQTRIERRSQLKRSIAKDLRKNATEPERRLWSLLRGKQMAYLRFRRQQPIGPYIVDFYCSAVRLVIELDGSQHGTNEAVAYDTARTKWLEERGYRVLRIANADLLRNSEDALEAIWSAVKNSGLPLPEPPKAVRPSLKGRVG
jgi:very-short-patch-repair endonuclease